MIRPSRVGRRLALVGLVGFVAGCGWRPLYSPGAAGAADVTSLLSQISVGLIPDRAGQLLRQALQARLEGNGTSGVRQYDLVVAYGIDQELVGIQPDNSSTRLRAIAHANFSLIAQDPSRRTVTAGTARAVDGANVFNQQYFALDLEVEEIQRRLAQAIADQITLQLAGYFRRAASTG